MIHQVPLDPLLFEYGIHTEASDIRAHVSVVNQTIYVFQTRSGRAAVAQQSWPIAAACQAGVDGKTADGWLVPVEAIEDLRRVKFHSWEGWRQFRRELSTSRKGQLAVLCAISAMQRGRFPMWLDAAEDKRTYVQQQGTDVLVFCRKRIQVKCDYCAGDPPAGSGNLFLQRSERNPLKRI